MSESYEQVLAEDQAQWRAWLQAHHDTSPGIWLVTWKKASGRPLLSYDAIVDEALCYGWVDSRPRSIDNQRSARLVIGRSRHGRVDQNHRPEPLPGRPDEDRPGSKHRQHLREQRHLLRHQRARRLLRGLSNGPTATLA